MSLRTPGRAPVSPRYAQPQVRRRPVAESTEPDAAHVVTYPYLRSVLAPQFAGLPAEQLSSLMEGEYGPGAAEQYDEYFESFLGDVGRFVSRAAPVVANIAGGVVKGAATGSSLGLPGIIGGAIAGGVGQGLASYGTGTLRDVGRGINTGIGLAGQFTGTGRIGSALGGALSDVGQGKNVLNAGLGAVSGLAGGMGGGALGQVAGLVGGRSGATGAVGSLAGLLGNPSNGAAGQLLGLLQRPEVMQSLGAMAMGAGGRQTVPVGSAQTPVPVSAFASLLGMLANRAADEQAALSDGSETDLRYLTDDAGEWVADPADDDQRAAVLYQLLNVANYERMLQRDQAQALQLQALQRDQQRQLRQERADREMQQRVDERRRQQEIETAMYDALDIAEATALAEDLDDVWASVDEDVGEYDIDALLDGDPDADEDAFDLDDAPYAFDADEFVVA